MAGVWFERWAVSLPAINLMGCTSHCVILSIENWGIW